MRQIALPIETQVLMSVWCVFYLVTDCILVRLSLYILLADVSNVSYDFQAQVVRQVGELYN